MTPLPLLFVRQDIRSDDCAICAITMLLAKCGIPASRSTVSEWFACEYGDRAGVTHADIKAAVAAYMPGRHVSWHHKRFKTNTGLMRFATMSLGSKPAVLMTGHCVYRAPRLRSQHAFLLLGTAPEGLSIIDPLGNRPRKRSGSNALVSGTFATSRELEVRGAPWTLNLAQPVSFLGLEVKT
jgi:hypothetical protein